MPLILAFYRIVLLHRRRRQAAASVPARPLHEVLRRMLTGCWRGSDDRQPDVDTCLRTLRDWAWSGAASHAASGVGTWADDIPAERARLAEAGEDALDHVAPPLGPADVGTGRTLRRFIHRSVREHLAAEHVAGLAIDQAAEAVLPHLWYDAD